MFFHFHRALFQQVTNIRWSLCLLFILAIAQYAPAQQPGYAFSIPPLEAIDKLARLETGKVREFDVDERRLLQEAWDQKLKDSPDSDRFLDALLYASNVNSLEQRVQYRKQFHQLVKKVESKCGDPGDPLVFGEKLMTFLHQETLRGGYELSQSSFSTMLDSGKFNCVSSAALYYAVGVRYGLRFNILCIPGSSFMPGHATLDLLVGMKKLHVEATNADGFDWQTKLSRPGVVLLSNTPDRSKAREVKLWGLPAMIYSNQAAGHLKGEKPDFLEAIRCGLAALALDPEDSSAINNVRAAIINCGPALMKNREYESGLKVLEYGLQLDPKSVDIKSNLAVVWMGYIQQTLDDANDEHALKLIRRAGIALQSDRDMGNAARWFCNLGERQIKASGWEAGLAIAERAKKVLTVEEQDEILKWKMSLFRRWSQEKLSKGDIESSFSIVERMKREHGSHREVSQAIAYHLQVALAETEKKGIAIAKQHFSAISKKFPNEAVVFEMGSNHAKRCIQQLAADHKFEEAVAAIETYIEFLPTTEDRSQLAGIAYDQWARFLSGKGQRQEALTKYQAGLQKYPNQPLLKNNTVALLDDWAHESIKTERWDDAIKIYDQGLKMFPNESHLTRNRDYCLNRKEGK
ncbi:MAG: hypothetical protein QM703_28960 [Gemmatales bacterium]